MRPDSPIPTDASESGLAAAPCVPEVGCTLCGDVATRARVLALDSATDTALVEEAELGAGACPSRSTVALDLMEGVRVGDVILVHQGFAIERVAP